MSDGLLQSLRNLFTLTDEQAMWRLQHSGDGEAFATLMERWRGPIARLCTRMTGDAHRGEDLAQEAFLKLYSQRHQYRAEGRFSSFLWRIALNLCHDESRRNRRRSEVPLESEDEDQPGHLDLLADDAPSASEQVEDNERAQIVSRALLRLPEHYRSVVVLKHYHGLKLREIAEVLGIPDGTVKSRLSEGLQQLGRYLTPHLAELGNVAEGRGRNRKPEELFIL